MNRSSKTRRAFTALLGWLLGAVFLFPLYVLAVNSFKTQKGIYRDVLAIPGEFFTLENYPRAFERLDFLRSLGNSLVISVASTGLIVFFTALAAWALVRRRSKISTVLFFAFASAMLIPFQCVMLPLVRLMSTPAYLLGILLLAAVYLAFVLAMAVHSAGGNQGAAWAVFAGAALLLALAVLLWAQNRTPSALNRTGLIFMYVGFGSSLSIVLFHGFIKNVPVELEEAATIDGCSPFRVFWQVVFPLLKTTSITVAILNLMWIWNDFLLPQLTINKEGWQTIPLKTYFFFGQFSKRWDLATAGLIMGMLPIVVFYLFCQKYIVKGITDGAIK